jgi:hypothetical protein
MCPYACCTRPFYAPIVADISYYEAWGMWLDGRSTLGNDLFGVPMIWWGRLGKISAFVGGATILLDIAGAERLRQVASRVRQRKGGTEIGIGILASFVAWLGVLYLWAQVTSTIDSTAPNSVLRILGITGAVIAYMAVVIAVCFGTVIAGAVALWKAADGLAAVLEHPRAVHLRVSAGLLLLFGFHFDLLAS